jgi:mycothiol synthase
MPTIARLSIEHEQPKQQLRMVWPQRLLQTPPALCLHPDYDLRTYRPGDEPQWIHVMALAGFDGWDDERVRTTMARILPDGWFMALHRATGELVATAMATHNPAEFHQFGGELGWVAGDPAHKGKGLGWSVCAAVTRRFLRAGYTTIYLRTDDWRYPALKTYLRLGYEPFLFAPDMLGRWQAVCEQLEWPFTPDAWPQPEPNSSGKYTE